MIKKKVTPFVCNEILFEVEKYINYQVDIDDPKKYSPLDFYHNNIRLFPNLAKIAKIFYTLPATSVPSEALFSQAGLIQTDIRNRLGPLLLEKLVFLKQTI